MRNKTWLFHFFLFFICLMGCTSNSAKFDTKELIDYFGTKNIKYKLVNNVLNISVTNSKLIEREYIANKEVVSEGFEAYASIGAIIATSSLKESQHNFDSIIFCINNRCYNYSIPLIEKMDNYINLSIKFLRSWEKKEYNLAKSYLSDELLKEFSNVEMLQQALSNIIPNKGIKDIKFNSFRVRGNVLGISINTYFEDEIAQTYIFSFLLSNAKYQIAGITIP